MKLKKIELIKLALFLIIIMIRNSAAAQNVVWGESNSRTEYRDDAGLRGDAGAISGFFQTNNPVNYPAGASSWWHLLDVRHTNPNNNFAMQFAGYFWDQDLYFRKTINDPASAWSRVLLERDGKVGIGNTMPTYAITLNNDKTISFNSDQINPFGIEGGDHAQTRIIMGASSGQSSNIAFGVSNGGGYAGFMEKMRLNANGYLGIGTISPAYPLDVAGTVRAKEVKVNLNAPAPDYVFEKDYKLPSLAETQKYIQENKHLPEVPSAKEMEEKGINLSEMNMLLLKKVEELTLHLIEKNELLDQEISLNKMQQVDLKDLKIKMEKVLTLINNKSSN